MSPDSDGDGRAARRSRFVAHAISRRMVRHNFYDALLEQDGHDLKRLTPPRDLREWQNQPVSHLANPRPVIADSLELKSLQKLLQDYPYNQFPVVLEGEIRGILVRDEANRAIRETRPALLRPAIVCPPALTLAQAEKFLIESPTGLILLQMQPGAPLAGILTLHDILRAQQAASEQGQA